MSASRDYILSKFHEIGTLIADEFEEKDQLNLKILELFLAQQHLYLIRRINRLNAKNRWNTYTKREQEYIENYLRDLYTEGGYNYDMEMLKLSAIAEFHFNTQGRRAE